MQNSPHLRSDAYEGGWSERIEATVEGMAHFARTGPAGTSCRQCANWGVLDRFRRDGDHRLRPRMCAKFLRMCQAETGPGVDPETPSCRHFEPRSFEPDLIKLPKRKQGAATAASVE